MSIINKGILTAIALSATTTYATTIQDYSFKSASLNGAGYSTFQMALENQQYQRSLAIQQALQAAAQQAKADAANTPINQFLTNLESRIYAQISQYLSSLGAAIGICSPTYKTPSCMSRPARRSTTSRNFWNTRK